MVDACGTVRALLQDMEVSPGTMKDVEAVVLKSKAENALSEAREAFNAIERAEGGAL